MCRAFFFHARRHDSWCRIASAAPFYSMPGESRVDAEMVSAGLFSPEGEIMRPSKKERRLLERDDLKCFNASSPGVDAPGPL